MCGTCIIAASALGAPVLAPVAFAGYLGYKMSKRREKKSRKRKRKKYHTKKKKFKNNSFKKCLKKCSKKKTKKKKFSCRVKCEKKDEKRFLKICSYSNCKKKCVYGENFCKYHK